MERVAFLVDGTGERIDCLLNPESLEVNRLAGVRVRGSGGNQFVGAGLADDPLLFTGGGRTEMSLDLVFDVDFVEAPVRPADVRVLTRRLWLLAENSTGDHGAVRPPLVRLVWGKSWNLPGVIVAVAERFDDFDAAGAPRRSWLRLKMVRIAESPARVRAGFEEELAATQRVPAATVPAPAAVQAIGDGTNEPGYCGVRFDLLADEATGSPLQWRALADHNDIDNPFTVPPGSVLAVPPTTAPTGPVNRELPGGAP
jgi:hypothetical protein